MSPPEEELPALRAAREIRARQAAEAREREAGQVPPDLATAALAFDGWQLALTGELGRQPTREEQADRFDQLAAELHAVVKRHALPGFWDMLPADPYGATLRLLLEPPRTDFRRQFLTLLNGDPQAFGPSLYYHPTQLRWLVEDYFKLRRLPEVLTLEGLQGWLNERTLSGGGRERLAVLRPEVGTLRAVLTEMGKTLPRFEFTAQGIDALVDEYFVPAHKGGRDRFLAMSVAEVVDQLVEASKADTQADARPVTAVGDQLKKVTSPSPTKIEFYPLTSWDEIISALNGTHTERLWANDETNRNKLRKLNAEYDGPIEMPGGRGQQPRVDRGRLLAWYAETKERYATISEESDQHTADVKGTTADTHAYGRTETVVPGVNGSQKKRKTKRSE